MFHVPFSNIFDIINNNYFSFFNCLQNNSFFECQLKYDPIISSLWILTFIIIYSFVWSLICNNVSKVDQIWSITPWVYSLHFCYMFYLKNNNKIHIRLFFMTGLMILWGIRLTYNFWRRGGYGNLISHEEDYRWPILRSKMSKPVFFIFNFTFIATYQNVLLWLIALPSYVVMQSKSHKLDVLDYALVVLFILFLIMETIADQQQYVFQNYKHSLSEKERASHSSPSIRDGFIRTGLWKYSRHPNYFAEQMMWFIIYCFSIVSSGHVFNYSLTGIVLLILLFQGSMAFGESITKSKYPKYNEYIATTSQCIPFGKSSSLSNVKSD